MSEDARALIKEFKVPDYLYDDALREIWIVEQEGRDVRAWLKYWLEQKEIELADREFLVYVDPNMLDQRSLEGNIDSEVDNPALRYDQYEGYVRDDV